MGGELKGRLYHMFESYSQIFCT